MSTGRVMSRVIITLVFAVLGASVGVCVQALQITGKPQEFRSVAKVLVGPSMTFGNSTIEDTKALAPLFEAIVKSLESPGLKHHALERVRALHPDLSGLEVKTQVTHIAGSHIFVIQTTGSNPKYVRIYLDALLDEFIAGSQPLQEQYDKLTPVETRSDINVHELASPALEIIQDWRLPLAAGAIGGSFLGAVFGLLLSLIILRSPIPPQIPSAL